MNRTNQNSGSETKTPTKKRTKGEAGSNKGTPTTVAGHITQMRHSLSSPQVRCGCVFIVASDSRSYIVLNMFMQCFIFEIIFKLRVEHGRLHQCVLSYIIKLIFETDF